MRISLSLASTLLVFLLLIAPATAERGSWHDLNGKPAPAIQVEAWMNAEGEGHSTKSLEGRVWLLSFFVLH